MSRIQDSGTPTIWNFQGTTPFTWTDLGKELIYNDDYVLGASHSDGTGGKINLVLEDLYDRIGYVKRIGDAAGNRGVSKNVVINASRDLTIDDYGIITVATVASGGTPTGAIELTLPLRADLVTAGSGYFERVTSAPFLDAKGSGLLPFIIKGYHTSAGIPLKVKVPNPTDPGTPVSGDDMAQNILIAGYSATEIYLYEGDYAEFLPLIAKDVATGLWYCTWTVHTHNTRYGNFKKGGNGTVVAVGTAGYPTTNFNDRGDYYEFAISNGADLVYLPDNSTIGTYTTKREGKSSLLYVKVNTTSSGNTWVLNHNGGSAPTNYKRIITPSGANMSMKDGDIVVLLEEASVWRVVSIIGSVSNFSNMKTLIDNEATLRQAADVILNNAIGTEAGTRAAADSNLQTQIDTINEVLTKVIEIGDWNMHTADAKSVAHGLGSGNYKKIRSIDVIIRDDSDTNYTNINIMNASGVLQGAIGGLTNTAVGLARLAHGVFDSTDFDSTGYNRGWVTIRYIQ